MPGHYSGPPKPPAPKPPKLSKQQKENRKAGIAKTQRRSAKEYQRRNAERLRQLRMNPDGTPKNTGPNEN